MTLYKRPYESDDHDSNGANLNNDNEHLGTDLGSDNSLNILLLLSLHREMQTLIMALLVKHEIVVVYHNSNELYFELRKIEMHTSEILQHRQCFCSPEIITIS